jgi:hypothetical protein
MKLFLFFQRLFFKYENWTKKMSKNENPKKVLEKKFPSYHKKNYGVIGNLTFLILLR